MTAAASAHNIGYVPALTPGDHRGPRPAIALTKRRAVDFGRTSTAICPACPQPAAG